MGSRPRHRAGPGGGLQWGSAVDDKRIYTANSNSDLKPTAVRGNTVNRGVWSALDKATGAVIWQQTTPSERTGGLLGTTSGPVTTANGVVFGCSLDALAYMYALDAATGAILWGLLAFASNCPSASTSIGIALWQFIRRSARHCEDYSNLFGTHAKLQSFKQQYEGFMTKGPSSRIGGAAALTLMAAILLGCSDPHKFEIAKLTEEQKQEMGKQLTADEGQKLAGYIVRTSFASKELPAGITVGQAIKEQELWIEKEKVEAAKAEELKKKVEAERKAKQEAFAKMLSVALVAKRNNLGEFDRRMVLLDLAYENKSDKEIAGVKGVLRLNDMFGDKIMNIRWSFDEGIGAKQTAVERGSGVKINQFMDDHMKLWAAEQDKIKATYEVQTIIFKDGTRLDAPES